MLRRLFLLFAVLGGTAAAAPDQAAAQADTAFADALYQVRIARTDRTVLPALTRDTAVLVPLQAVLRMAEVRVVSVEPGVRLAARIEPEGVPLQLDLAAVTAARGDSTRPLAPFDAVWREGEFYVAAPLAAWLLDIGLDVDRTELVIIASRTERLPAMRRRARERQRQALRDPFGAELTLLDAAAPPTIGGGGVLDWSYLGAARDPLGTAGYQLALGTQVAGGGLEASVRHQRSPFDHTTDFRATWTGAWPASRHVRQARVGDFFSGARRTQVIQGIELSNAPYLRSAAFGAELLDGRLGAGWQVDVLRDGQLVGFADADSTGAYQLALPVQYGTNAVEIEATGPAGERVRRRLLLVVPFDRLPAGVAEYTVSGGRCRQSTCTAALQSQVRYGLSPAVTVEAGADFIWRDSLPDVHAPYALVAASPLPIVHTTAEIVLNGFVRGRAEYAPSPDLQVEAMHTVYDTSVVRSPLGGGTMRQSSDLTLFWRPFTARRSLVLQASAVRARGVYLTRDQLSAAIIAPLHGARVTGGIGWERSGASPAAAHGALLMQGALDAVLRSDRPWLDGAFVRSAVTLRSDDGLALIGASVGRRLTDAVRIDVGAAWRRGAGMALDVGFSTELGGARLASRTRYSGGGLDGTQTAEGSMTWNARERRVTFGGGRSLGRSSVRGVVYIDANGNGARDPGEPAAPGIQLRVGSRGAMSDSTGHFEAFDIMPFEAITVSVHAASIANPLWVPAVDGVRLTPRPNTVELVELPLAQAGELTGTLVRAADDRAVGGVGFTLRHLGTGAVTLGVSFADGEFYVSGLRPGSYTLEIEPGMLEPLGLRHAPQRVTVRPFGAADEPVRVTLEPRARDD